MTSSNQLIDSDDWADDRGAGSVRKENNLRCRQIKLVPTSTPERNLACGLHEPSFLMHIFASSGACRRWFMYKQGKMNKHATWCSREHAPPPPVPSGDYARERPAGKQTRLY